MIGRYRVIVIQGGYKTIRWTFFFFKYSHLKWVGVGFASTWHTTRASSPGQSFWVYVVVLGVFLMHFSSCSNVFPDWKKLRWRFSHLSPPPLPAPDWHRLARLVKYHFNQRDIDHKWWGLVDIILYCNQRDIDYCHDYQLHVIQCLDNLPIPHICNFFYTGKTFGK